MVRTLDRPGLRIKFHVEGFTPLREEVDKMEKAFDTLAEQVRYFPRAHLGIHIAYHPSREVYHVKADLSLPKRVLFTGERDRLFYHAFERTIRKLSHKLGAYKEAMGGINDRQKEIARAIARHVPNFVPDISSLEEAVREEDFSAFAVALSPFEIGRAHV